MKGRPLKDKIPLRETLEVVKKFGFISRDVFWEFFCPPGKTARYDYWSELCNSNIFSSYSWGSGVPEHLSLSQLGKKLVGQDAISSTSMTYLSHDEIVMRFYLEMCRNSSLFNGWSEGELKADRSLAIKTLGSGIVSKLPDLVFDVSGGDEYIRCALEVERTRKSLGRYKTMRRAYSQTAKIDLLIVAVADTKIETVISNELMSSSSTSIGREIAFFDIDEFNGQRLESELRVVGKETTLKKFFETLESNQQKYAEKARKVSA